MTSVFTLPYTNIRQRLGKFKFKHFRILQSFSSVFIRLCKQKNGLQNKANKMPQPKRLHNQSERAINDQKSIITKTSQEARKKPRLIKQYGKTRSFQSFFFRVLQRMILGKTILHKNRYNSYTLLHHVETGETSTCVKYRRSILFSSCSSTLCSYNLRGDTFVSPFFSLKPNRTEHVCVVRALL